MKVVFLKIENSKDTWDRVLSYPTISTKLEEVLKTIRCPRYLRGYMDRALQVNLEGGLLAKEFTVYEALGLDNWVSQNNRPKGFPKALAAQLKNEFGIGFKNDRAC